MAPNFVIDGQPVDARTLIGRALGMVGMYDENAVELLLGTAIQESALKYTHQIGGPALGYWQMEPATHDDIWVNFLKYRTQLALMVARVASQSRPDLYKPDATLMASNPYYACVMARLKYLRSTMPLPQKGDLPGQARMWKEVYNTAQGAGTEAEFIQHWHEFCG